MSLSKKVIGHYLLITFLLPIRGKPREKYQEKPCSLLGAIAAKLSINSPPYLANTEKD